MNELNKLKVICEKFLNKEYTIHDVQLRIMTVNITHEFPFIKKALDSLDSELETIGFTQLEVDHFNCARLSIGALYSSVCRLGQNDCS